MGRHARAALVAEQADDQGGVLSRAQLRELEVSRHEVKREVAAGRWRLLGVHTVAVSHELQPRAEWWRAVWESGQQARLDGVTALLAAGLKHWTEPLLHVSVPRGSHARRVPGVRIHAVRRLEPACGAAVPTTRGELAVIRAAQWAASDRAATALIAMSVQQRLVATDRLSDEWRTVTRSPRRALLDVVIRDVCDGAQSLHEIDFAALCRARGLPSPTRQSVRTGPRGRTYLDAEWEEHGVVVEVDGAQHGWGLGAVDDALRDNLLRIDGAVTLRFPVLGLRLRPDAFMDQLAAALRRSEERQKVRAS